MAEVKTRKKKESPLVCTTLQETSALESARVIKVITLEGTVVIHASSGKILGSQRNEGSYEDALRAAMDEVVGDIVGNLGSNAAPEYVISTYKGPQ